MVDHFDAPLAICEVHKILLRPSVEVALARNEQREVDFTDLLDAIGKSNTIAL